jgi:ABC-type multidrug transport system ATPase subunit
MAVFDQLSFEMRMPGFNALFGPSGVGKTSLAYILVGKIADYAGSVRTNGMRTLLYSYNLERLPDWSSVGKHLEKITPPSLKDRLDELIESFNMAPTMGNRFSQLSLGQRNRVNLIRYLLQDFDLLIMDESLANVDERTREKIIFKIKDMFPQTYFLYISHNVVEVSTFCKEILVFRNPRKKPQLMTINGCDRKLGQAIDKDQLEQTMLEIMHAS